MSDNDGLSEAERLRARLAELERQEAEAKAKAAEAAENERMRARLAELEQQAAEAQAKKDAEAAAVAEADEKERMRARLEELEREAEAQKAAEAERAASLRAEADAAETERVRARLEKLEREAEEAAAADAARAAAAAAAAEETEAKRMRERVEQLEREAAEARRREAAAPTVAAAAGAAATTAAATTRPEPAAPAAQWAEPQKPKRRGGLVALVVVEVVALAAASALLIATLAGIPIPGLSGGTGGAVAAIGGGPEVELVQASTVGSAPFNEIPFGNLPDPAVATADTQSDPAAGSALNTTAVPGSTPYIYGRQTGATTETLCNRDGIAAYFTEDADAASAAADAFAADAGAAESAGSELTAASLPEWITGMSRVTLVADTLVTLAGRTDDGTEAQPTVLQKGTEVLVDDRGVPRVKCFGANPLTAAPEVSGAPTFVGTAWAGFDPDIVATITPADEAMLKIDIVTPALASGEQSYVTFPGYEPVLPAAVTCEPSGYSQDTTPATFTVTNSSDQTVQVFSQDSQDTGCGVNLQWILAPGQSFSYPFPEQTFVPYPGIVLLATVGNDGQAVWQTSLTPGQSSADITF